MTQGSCCDDCNFYLYDEEDDCYVCDMDLDEDEMYHFLTGRMSACPYYQPGDEYLLVRHQM